MNYISCSLLSAVGLQIHSRNFVFHGHNRAEIVSFVTSILLQLVAVSCHQAFGMSLLSKDQGAGTCTVL